MSRFFSAKNYNLTEALMHNTVLNRAFDLVYEPALCAEPHPRSNA